jgi:hypothetical protein
MTGSHEVRGSIPLGSTNHLKLKARAIVPNDIVPTHQIRIAFAGFNGTTTSLVIPQRRCPKTLEQIAASGLAYLRFRNLELFP